MARERYLHGAGEETIHNHEITADTGREKAENWWFYHKNKLIVLLLAAAMLFSIFYSIFSKEKPDYTVAMLTSFTMPTNGVEELERCLEEYADDRNGDGKVVVHVETYVFSGKEATSEQQYQQEQAAMARFSVDTTLNDSMLFLHDATAFELFKPDFEGFFQYKDGSPMPSGATDFENAMTDWAEIPALASFVPQTADSDDAFSGEGLSLLYDRLRLSVRTNEGADFDDETQRYYEASLALKDHLFAGG